MKCIGINENKETSLHVTVILQTGTVDCTYRKVEQLYKKMQSNPPPYHGNKYSTRNQLCTEQKTNVLLKEVSKGFIV